MSSSVGSGPKAQLRQRLHSLTFHWLRRIFALLFAADALHTSVNLWGQAQVDPAAFSAVLHVAAFLLIAHYLWFRGRAVFATDRGLELVSGSVVRLVPWLSLIDVREMPWMTLHPPWYPKLYQLDLPDGESLDFVGRRNAIPIVRAAQQRARLAARV